MDHVVLVREVDTIRLCRQLAGHGFLFGGSTGTALHGALQWLAEHDPEGWLTAVAIGPDLGERYLDTVYDDAWVLGHYGPEALEPDPGDEDLLEPRALTPAAAER